MGERERGQFVRDMQLQGATFDADDVERLGMGAGVVPVAVDPDGVVHLLLGRERFLPHWKGSCRWSGFEGSRKPDEALRDTAAREFAEESLGVVLECDALARALRERDYWIRIVLRIHHDRRAERYHATYVVPVPWDPELPKRFLRTRLDLEHVDRAAQEWRYAAERALVEPAAAAERERQHARVERALTAHPGVRVRRDPGTGALASVELNRDHLEKDQVRWWSAEKLGRVLDGRGTLGPDRFRPYFLPVLQTLLQELRRAPPASAARAAATCALTSSSAARTAPSEGASTTTCSSSGWSSVTATKASAGAARSSAGRSADASVCRSPCR